MYTLCIHVRRIVTRILYCQGAFQHLCCLFCVYHTTLLFLNLYLVCKLHNVFNNQCMLQTNSYQSRKRFGVSCNTYLKENHLLAPESRKLSNELALAHLTEDTWIGLSPISDRQKVTSVGNCVSIVSEANHSQGASRKCK